MPAEIDFCTISNPPRPLTSKHVSAEGQAALQERPSDYLVHGVVPADVFPQDQQLSFGVEKCRGVQAACAAKDGLRGAQFFGQLAKDFGIELRCGFGAAQAATAELVDGGLSAHAASRAGGKSAGGAARLEAHFGIEGHAHEVALWRAIAGQAQRHEVFSPGEDAFGEKKTGDEFLVVSRRAKSDAEGVSSRAHLQRLFGGQEVFDARGFAVFPLGDLGELDVAGFLGHG